MDILQSLVEKNIVFLPQVITSETAIEVVQDILYIASENNDPINVFIQSEGGEVASGFAIINAMRMVKNVCRTICIGETASMGSYILAAGEKGHRYCLPLVRIMIHQISAGTEGNLPNMEIQLKEAKNYNELLLKDFAKNVGQTLPCVRDKTNNDLWMSAQEACEFGIVDKVIKTFAGIK